MWLVLCLLILLYLITGLAVNIAILVSLLRK
nr:MAG TPA: hypothetical protein [Caudoviricetes sp.]